MEEDWDAQKMLDLYIHDYMVRKNMHSTAEIFAKEANVSPNPVGREPPEGFLSDWFSLFWDTYSTYLKPPNSTTEPLIEANNDLPPMPKPNIGCILKNVCPAMKMSGIPSLLPSYVPSLAPNLGRGESLLQSVVPSRVLRPEEQQSGLGQLSIRPDHNLMQMSRPQTPSLVDARIGMQETPMMPSTRDFNSNSELYDITQFAGMLPSSSSSSNPLQQIAKKHLLQLIMDEGPTAFRRIASSEMALVGAPTLIPSSAAANDSGRDSMANQVFPQGWLSDGVGEISGSAEPNQQQGFLLVTDDSSDTLPASDIQLLQEILYPSGNSSSLENPFLSDQNLNQRNSQKGKNVIEIDELCDQNVGSCYNVAAACQRNTFLGSLLPSSIDDQGFCLKEVASHHVGASKLLCCDFSTPGDLLAVSGHDRKILIWDIASGSTNTLEGHPQLITDLRFQHNSTIFATSSFDSTVQLYNMLKPQTSPVRLMGHADPVLSVDFHPSKANLLCSCDKNNNSVFWDLNTLSCIHCFRGADGQVRFQPRVEQLLAAASGNVINLIDIETGIIKTRMEGHIGKIKTLCWDPTGRYIASVSEDSARIWSVVLGGKCMYELHSPQKLFVSCTLHPASNLVMAIGTYQSIEIWQPLAGTKTWKYRAHNDIVSGLASSLATQRIASVSFDWSIKLWK